MEKSEIKTRLVEENNTIYEIDLDCLKRKEQRKKEKKEDKKRSQKIRKLHTENELPQKRQLFKIVE